MFYKYFKVPLFLADGELQPFYLILIDFDLKYPLDIMLEKSIEIPKNPFTYLCLDME